MALPVSTSAVGRSFSDMKKIKDHHRNRLLSTSLIAIEGLSLAKVDFDAVLSLWKSMNQEGTNDQKKGEKHKLKNQIIAFLDKHFSI